jgi:hypothetical protein
MKLYFLISQVQYSRLPERTARTPAARPLNRSHEPTMPLAARHVMYALIGLAYGLNILVRPTPPPHGALPFVSAPCMLAWIYLPTCLLYTHTVRTSLRRRAVRPRGRPMRRAGPRHRDPINRCRNLKFTGLTHNFPDDPAV